MTLFISGAKIIKHLFWIYTTYNIAVGYVPPVKLPVNKDPDKSGSWGWSSGNESYDGRFLHGNTD